MGFPDLNLPANSFLGNKEPKFRPGEHTYDVEIPALVKEGVISQTELDAHVRPILVAKMKLGLFEHPYVDESKTESVLTDPAHRTLARATTGRTMVLLRNEGSVLPWIRE